MSSEQVADSNSHHERRFAQIDRDIYSVKTDVGVLQADVKTLAAGQLALQESQDRGFRDVKETLLAKSQEQPKITIGMLVSLIGVCVTMVAVGVGAFWSVVVLLADPIKEDLSEHKASTLTNGRDIALLDERYRQLQTQFLTRSQQMEDHNQERHDIQTQQMGNLSATVQKLEARSDEALRTEGKIEALEEVRRLNEQRTYERIRTIEDNQPRLRTNR